MLRCLMILDAAFGVWADETDGGGATTDEVESRRERSRKVVVVLEVVLAQVVG